MSPRVPHPGDEETYTVSQLGAEVRALVGGVYGSLWVSGEVQRVRRSARGHLYFELIEKGAGDEIAARIEAVVWRTDLERVEKAFGRLGLPTGIAEGQQARVRASLDFFAPQGRLQLAVRDVDATATLGELERRRRETLEWLAARELLERQAGLALGDTPLRVGLVTSAGSAACEDFLATLRESGYAFAVALAHVSVQGARAESEILGALAALERAGASACDVVVLVRGGGSRADLAAFDGRRLAAAIARHPLPVITGLGHEIDQSVADRVAHRAVKTPTKAAELLVECLRRAEDRERAVGRNLRDAAAVVLDRARSRLGRGGAGLRHGLTRLRAGRARVDALARLLSREGTLAVREADRQRHAVRERLRLAGRVVVPHAQRLDGIERLLYGLRPEHVLRRGYSITRGADGSLVRDPAHVVVGAMLSTQVARGILRSRAVGPESGSSPRTRRKAYDTQLGLDSSE